MDFATDYVGDWRFHDFVEDASYESPPDVGPKRVVGGLKAKRENTASSLQPTGGLYDESEGANAIVWNPTDSSLQIRPQGVVVMETSGRQLVLSSRQDRFGVWFLTVQPLIENDASPD